MPYCQQFKAQIQEWKKELEEAKVLLWEYLESGKEEKTTEIKGRMENILHKQKAFLEGEYKEHVIEMAAQWKSWIEKQFLEFTNEGRVVLDIDHLRIGFPDRYFPSIIKAILGRVSLEDVPIKDIAHLEEVGSLYIATGCKIETMSRLKRIGNIKAGWGQLILNNSFFKIFPNLETVERGICLTDFQPLSVRGFRGAFPKLQRVGKNVAGISIALPKQQSPLPKGEIDIRKDIQRLKRERQIIIDGKIGHSVSGF